MILRRRFSDVVTRQLDVFADDESDGLLAEVQEMKERYDRADRGDAEQAYGDYVDVIDAVKDALADMRERYARTLEDPAEYEQAFERAARRRWRWLA